MKAAIVLALIGSVMAAPPLMAIEKRPDEDRYSHIFAEVRPPGQKPQNMELQFQQQHGVEYLQVEEQHHQSSVQGQLEPQQRPNSSPNHLEVKPVEQKPQHVVEVEIKQQRPNSSPNHVVELEVKPVAEKPQHVVEVEIKQQRPNSSPNHVVELEVKPVAEKPQHVVEVEIKQQRPNHQIEVEQRPQHVEFEIKQHHENSAQGHLVSLAAKPVEQKPQTFEFDMAVDQQVQLPQHLELEIAQDNTHNGKLMMAGQQIQHLNLSQRH